MAELCDLRWLEWAREIQSLCQTGLAYSTSGYDTERYRRLMDIAAAIVASHTQLSRDGWLQNFLAQPGYATPKVDVRGAIIRDGRILLVQERSDECWCMPGGWADVGEFPSSMVVREVWEESGFAVVPCKVIGVYDANRSGIPLEFYHAYKIVFRCEITGGAARPSDETLAADFFPFEALPPLSSARTNEKHLAEVLAHWRDPQRPTYFD
ncbi:MAG: NUDIX hydrolase [Candidatus Tectomicrobia bacterium]|uniref:NUDIX hydrolase n=1 Tax=Tectimicrobiota bacterium TaxID=2528274 RepID=A0A932CLZ1_UNCTE|nr:NUDIX hydrolase [Candidatus Tectomicrobia bacterium]